MTTVLQVLSAARVWTLKDSAQHPTGFWAEEFVVPYTLFTARPTGTSRSLPPVANSPSSTNSASASKAACCHRGPTSSRPNSTSSPLYSRTRATSSTAAPTTSTSCSTPAAPMEDLAVDETSGALLTRRLASARPLALLCHAPAALLAAKNADGSWPFAGYTMSGLSNAEERLNPFAWKAKWLLEDRLKQAGAHYTAGLPLKSKVVVDRNLYTGQNPGSSAALARRIITDVTVSH
jgi:putative intracellular protease/amidase